MNQVYQHPIKKRKDGLGNSYGVEISYAPNLNIQYIINVDYLESLESDYHCKFSRKQFFINGKQPTRLIDTLAEKCMNAIYPIHFRTNSYGLIREVLNFDEIKERWQLKQKTLISAYQGEFVENYFSQINRSFESKDTLLKAMQRELFYSLFSFQMEAATTRDNQMEHVDYKLPIYPYRLPVEFIGNQKIIDSGKSINITYNGKDRANNNLSLNQKLESKDLTLVSTEGAYKGISKEITFKLRLLKERQRKIV